MSRLYPDGALLLAPLSGYTDLPFRRSVRRHGCRFAFTEMIDAAALVYARARTENMLTRGADESWLGVQLVSADAAHLKRAVTILNGYEFDVVDFNLGCPVPKVTKKGAGAALGQDVDRALELFSIIAEGSRFPVTAKIRILDRSDPEPTLRLVRGLAARGARALTVHGRLRAEFYSGEPAYGMIETVARELTVPVIGNGGVFGRASFDLMREGCPSAAGVMIARGAMGNPWIFSELADPDFMPPTVDELVDEAGRHVEDIFDFYGEERGGPLARKIVLDYFRGRGFNGEWRGRAGSLSTRAEYREYLASAPRFHSSDYWKNPPADRFIRG
ncbi:MAG: tRNA-dihydrouridine synthase [Victivallaceae bacterium]|nr:tRNA-dihydrouridine synthase [Victivallaceae bacterium]